LSAVLDEGRAEIWRFGEGCEEAENRDCGIEDAFEVLEAEEMVELKMGLWGRRSVSEAGVGE
jgi:hypothetical protein